MKTETVCSTRKIMPKRRKFIAILKETELSRDLLGKERAGRRIGPITAIPIGKDREVDPEKGINTHGRFYDAKYYKFEEVK